jgi:hypothetical protein
VGQHIVFGPGEYRPHTAEGRGLLAHELAHTVQQGDVAGRVPEALEVAPDHDDAEREATAAAEALGRGQPVHPVVRRPVAVARADGDPPAAGGGVCGPDVTALLIRALAKTRSAFAGWTDDFKAQHCEALTSYVSAGVAWDINELHNHGWLDRYHPECATGGAGNKCDKSVWVQSDCYYPGSVNYVVYGVMMRLCHDFYSALIAKMSTWDRYNPFGDYVKDKNAEDSYTEDDMLDWIKMYKGTRREVYWVLGGPPPGTVWRDVADNFVDSQKWASAGYRGWPMGGSTPAGDRSGCAQCSLNYYDGRSASRLPHHTNPDGTIGFNKIATGEFSIHWVYKKWPAGWTLLKEKTRKTSTPTSDPDEYFGGGDPDWHPDPHDYGYGL